LGNNKSHPIAGTAHPNSISFNENMEDLPKTAMEWCQKSDWCEKAVRTWELVRDKADAVAPSIELSELPLDVILYSIAAVLFSTFLFYFARGNPERAVDYVVEEPVQLKAGWKGEILCPPSIQVCDSIETYSIQLTKPQ
jgi:hypothetical protein